MMLAAFSNGRLRPQSRNLAFAAKYGAPLLLNLNPTNAYFIPPFLRLPLRVLEIFHHVFILQVAKVDYKKGDESFSYFRAPFLLISA